MELVWEYCFDAATSVKNYCTCNCMHVFGTSHLEIVWDHFCGRKKRVQVAGRETGAECGSKTYLLLLLLLLFQKEAGGCASRVYWQPRPVYGESTAEGTGSYSVTV